MKFLTISLMSLLLGACVINQPVTGVNALRDILHLSCTEMTDVAPHEGAADNDAFCTCAIAPLLELEMTDGYRDEFVEMLDVGINIRKLIVREMIVKQGRKHFVACARLGEKNA